MFKANFHSFLPADVVNPAIKLDHISVNNKIEKYSAQETMFQENVSCYFTHDIILC